MQAGERAEAAMPVIDVLVTGLGPGGCAAALAARAEGLSTLAVEARGPEATRSQLILVRPGAQAALRQLGLPDITEGRRTTTIRHVENRLRGALVEAARADTGPAAAPFELCWYTSLVDLEVGSERVVVTLRDEATGLCRQVAARHVIDASGGRIEALGRPARTPAGPSHLVIAAEYNTLPWFEGIVGMHDPATHDLCLLFPTWGRRGVIAYFDSQPGRSGDGAALVQRFELVIERLALGAPKQPLEAIDVFQRRLARPSADRVVAIGDSVGTVDVLLGAGASTAIEDGADAARAIAAAQRERTTQAELAGTLHVNARIFARHRASARRGRLMLTLRPVLERLWPSAAPSTLERASVGPPPLLWPAVRFVFGRRPQAS